MRTISRLDKGRTEESSPSEGMPAASPRRGNYFEPNRSSRNRNPSCVAGVFDRDRTTRSREHHGTSRWRWGGDRQVVESCVVAAQRALGMWSVEWLADESRVDWTIHPMRNEP